MEDRYEIRGKIGAGGLGTVYRGFDLKMKREVAIKRILTNPDDPTVQEEATKQLAAEAGALASLQHPHIVTVYDVGTDEDGPYVVMELIEGRTLDDIIETEPLTWKDFRELAMQTQEALIAAQELNMIHSDLKPPNLMLRWLPSGKFQVKIVDFGLAMLAQNQNAEELATIETVFGSIFFMPPEQFEREVLDARSDLYSMGCVYYQCLTGKYPFMGYDGEEVMNAHLNHTVTPIQDIRADVPIWVCDWVMWQINREREDRPQSAREALAVFLQNNRQSNPEMSIGRPKKAGPKFIIPGQDAGDPDAPEPIRGVPLKPPGDAESVEDMAVFEDVIEEEEPPPPAKATTVQVAKAQPTGQLTPTSPLGTTGSLGTTTSPLSVTPTRQVTPEGQEEQDSETPKVAAIAKPPKPPMSTAAKAMIGVVLGIAIIITGMILLDRSKQNKASQRLNQLLQAAAGDTNEVPMSPADLDLILETIAYSGAIEDRQQYYDTLKKAKAPEGKNYDISILNFTKGENILTEVRSTLIGEVLRDRANPEMLPLLLDYAAETTDDAAAVACFRAAYALGKPGNVDEYLKIITTTKKSTILSEAGRNLGYIIDNSAVRDSIATKIGTAYGRTKDPNVQFALIRLLGKCSTDSALKEIRKALDSEERGARMAAISALSKWKDGKAVAPLMEYMSTQSDATVRASVLKAALTVASLEESLKNEDAAKTMWNSIRQEVTTTREKMAFINAAVIMSAPWRKSLVQPFTQDADSEVKDFAGRGVTRIDNDMKLQKKGNE